MTTGMTLETLRAVITGSFPELFDSEFKLLTVGWDCVAVDVDDRLIFKFPRHEAAVKALVSEAGLLRVVRPVVTMPVPDLTVYREPRLFSRHVKLSGEHLVTRQFDLLPVESRQQLAADMALFYAQLHRIDAADLEAAGAEPIKSWLSPEDILRLAKPVLSPGLRTYADETITTWQQLPPDPHGVTYGFFDGHGWNMAFDHERNRLNGIYDFGDSGFGSLHQEFIYSNFISPDLTERIIAEYEVLTGLAIDRDRVDLLSRVLRLSELAEEAAKDSGHFEVAMRSVETWAERARADGA